VIEAVQILGGAVADWIELVLTTDTEGQFVSGTVPGIKG